ncbi:MAG: T9SS type A sorting domain-containing protein [Chitinophagaceae bacterium]|nr:MAG: T9SS type A sorting domain-containing protein [Chitinophagaceae bacterium]
MRKIYPLILSALMAGYSTSAQLTSPWTRVQESAASQDLFTGRTRPAAYQLYRLEESGFRNRMAGAPSEKTTSVSRSGFTVSFPYTDGRIEEFRVVDAPVMNPVLAAKFPGINSYSGRSIKDPSVTIRFDVTPQGVHGMILSPDNETVYIDPAGPRSGKLYRVVSRRDLDEKSLFRCETPEGLTATSANTAGKAGSADDGKLRTYKLALCASLSFSTFFLDGTETTDAQKKAKVIAAQVTQITRANAIFERDFALRLELVANNDLVISVSSADNPWASGNLNTITQNICDTRIGDGNYDIGHVVNRASDNGNAGFIGCVCVSGRKGSAFTSYTALAQTEYFVVDYLVHEMGHQLGANHTFSFSYENTLAQTEPGSGSTIMGYAGITNSNVQEHSDDYFNAISIQQVTDYIKTGNGSFCPVETNTGNTAPVTDAGADYVIPHSTPFTLTGSATDANNDNLTYTWEQNTRATASTPAFPTTSSTGSLFRSFRPSTNPVRTFPALAHILDGTNTDTWERLPSVGRTLTFRLTTRDNRAGGAANSFDEASVQFHSATGPFRVTTANIAVTMEELSTQTITWNVAGSDAAPVSCAQVNILLSRDGGQTFPVTLAAATPNDGSQLITIPSGLSNTARIKIESVGNIFFDINDVNFQIIVPACAPLITTQPASSTLCIGSAATFSVAATGAPLTYLWQVSTDGTSYANAPGANSSSTYSISNIQPSLSGNRYRVTITGGCTPNAVSGAATLTVVSPPVISAAGNPTAKVICETGNVSFTAAASGTATVIYKWQVSTNGTTYTDLADGGVYSGTGTSTLTLTNVTNSLNGNLYRIAASNATCNTPVFSTGAALTVNARPTVDLSAAPLTVLLPGQSTTLTAAINPAPTGFDITWFRDDQLLPGVNGITYLVDSVSTGNYLVRIVNQVTGCNNQSAPLAITTTPSTRLFIFPNPSTGQFTVSYYNSAGTAGRQTITIFDSKGLQVYNGVLSIAGPYTLSNINLSGKGRGVYYIVIGDTNGKKLSESKVLIH